MKIIKNVLSENLYNDCIKDLRTKLDSSCWASSSFRWDKNIRDKISGVCIMTMVSPAIRVLLDKELKSYLPKYNQLMCQYYVWQPHAGISRHNDKAHKFGATIYLNEKWSPNDGGWFIWEDTKTKNTGIYKSLLPKKNVMILNNKREEHLVTSVSSGCLENRYTIQIWGG